LSLERLVYLDGQQAVIYKGLKHNPTLGRNFETMDPLDWNGWREWRITSRTLGNIAPSSTATMPIECADIAPRRSRERARSKSSQPRSAAVARYLRLLSVILNTAGR